MPRLGLRGGFSPPPITRRRSPASLPCALPPRQIRQEENHKYLLTWAADSLG